MPASSAEAFDMFGRIQAFNTITGAGGYLMVMRGIFKENTRTRRSAGRRRSGGGRRRRRRPRPVRSTKPARRPSATPGTSL